MKNKLSVSQQISHMIAKGITFNHISQNDAVQFLEKNNYYFRIKSYAKNYEKYHQTKKQGQYINLDFAYLKELSIIDMHLRRALLRMTLDIEHRLKVRLLNDVLQNDGEDGYAIIQDFFKQDGSKIKSTLNSTYTRLQTSSQRNSYTSELVQKYHPNYPIWNIVEIISFGDLIILYKFCYKRFGLSKAPFSELFWSTKIIRNATAHNNCILNNLRTKIPTQLSNTVRTFLKANPNTEQLYYEYKDCYVMMDIISVCYLYNELADSNRKREIFKHILTITNKVLTKAFFQKNRAITEPFKLLENTIKLLLAA